jgi:hypothetical protein
MTPLKLSAIPENNEDRIPPSIVVNNRADKHLCTLWADNRVTFNPEFDFSSDELSQICELNKHFFTFYNSLIEKDEAIAVLKENNKTLMKELMLSLTPINERQ